MDEFGTELGTAHGAKPAQLLLLARLLLGANVIDAIAVIAVGMFAVACDLALVIVVLPDFLCCKRQRWLKPLVLLAGSAADWTWRPSAQYFKRSPFAAISFLMRSEKERHKPSTSCFLLMND